MTGPAPTQDSDMTRCDTCEGSGLVKGELVPKTRYDSMKERLQIDLAIAQRRLDARPTWWQRNDTSVFLATIVLAVFVFVGYKLEQAGESAKANREKADLCLRESGINQCLCYGTAGFNDEALQCYVSLASATEAKKPSTEKTPQ